MHELNAPVIAAFDFDGTLTERDTLLPFLRHLLGLRRLLWVLLLASPWLLAYALRLMSNHRAKARLLQLSLAGRSAAQVQACAESFVHQILPGLWNPWALRQLLQHQSAGHRCLIISASTSPYMHIVGRALGVADVLCTEMEVHSGHYSGHMATPNCHGEEKVRRLHAWLAHTLGPQAQPTLHAYGDTAGDKPLLRLASTAWYRGKPWNGR